jgi:hypothetical protein
MSFLPPRKSSIPATFRYLAVLPSFSVTTTLVSARYGVVAEVAAEPPSIFVASDATSAATTTMMAIPTRRSVSDICGLPRDGRFWAVNCSQPTHRLLRALVGWRSCCNRYRRPRGLAETSPDAPGRSLGGSLADQRDCQRSGQDCRRATAVSPQSKVEQPQRSLRGAPCGRSLLWFERLVAQLGPGMRGTR